MRGLLVSHWLGWRSDLCELVRSQFNVRRLSAPSAIHNGGEPLIADSQGPHKVGSTRRVSADCVRNIREPVFLVRDVIINGGIVVEVDKELPG
jgi:hypothetical protein